MSDGTRDSEIASGAATTRQPGLGSCARSSTAWRATPPNCPSKATSRPSMARTSMAQLGAAHAPGPPRPSRPRRLLDLHLHQLAAHAPISAGVGREIRGRRSHGDRRSHARVRLRARHRQRRRAVARLRRRVPDRHRQRLRGVDSVREPLLAGAVHRRCRGPHPVPPFRRGRVRDGRDGGAAVADRSRCGRRRSGSRVRRPSGVRGRGRLADA